MKGLWAILAIATLVTAVPVFAMPSTPEYWHFQLRQIESMCRTAIQAGYQMERPQTVRAMANGIEYYLNKAPHLTLRSRFGWMGDEDRSDATAFVIDGRPWPLMDENGTPEGFDFGRVFYLGATKDRTKIKVIYAVGSGGILGATTFERWDTGYCQAKTYMPY